MPQLFVKRLDDRDKDIPLPAYATAHSSGMDIRINTDIEILPGEVILAPTGIALEIPEGYEGQVRPRSGLALKHGVTLLNSPGTIDSDYRGPVGVILANFGSESFTVKRGDRIAQMIVARVERAAFYDAPELATSERGAGGFGSTGISA